MKHLGKPAVPLNYGVEKMCTVINGLLVCEVVYSREDAFAMNRSRRNVIQLPRGRSGRF